MILVTLFARIYKAYLSALKAYESLIKVHTFYYHKVEAKILENEESERYRIKKSILLYYTYLMITCYMLLPIVNPEASKIKSAINVVSALCQIFIIKGKNYHLIGSYAYLQSILSVILEYFTDGEPLTMIILVLANQHMFFLFPESQILGIIYIPLMILVIRQMQQELFTDFALWNPKLEVSIKSLYNSWPLLFLFHHYGAKNLTTSYRLALIGNMEIQKELKTTLSLLEKTNKELKDAIVARELFIASVSHELRNPLNCMVGNIELLRMDIKEEKWLKALETCKICGEVLLGQINNVLDVAKINAEKLELHYVPGNFYGLIEKVWKILSIPIKQKNLRGELRISRNFPKYIEMDSHRLTQIFLNLIGNASKFTQTGSINIEITWHQGHSMANLKRPSKQYLENLAKKRDQDKYVTYRRGDRRTSLEESLVTGMNSEGAIVIEERDSKKLFSVEGILKREMKPRCLSHVLEETASYIHLTVDDAQVEEKMETRSQQGAGKEGIIKIEVTDTGCGMSVEALNNLFQAFRQADSSITRQYGGTGLGLYISKQIITKMGGEIDCYSEENVGSNFCILLPAKIASQSDVKEEAGSQTSKQCLPEDHLMRALIVDDIAGNQQVLKSYLKKLNVATEVANNGLEALNMVKARGIKYYDFITMDLQMPIMDGMTSTMLIREFERDEGSTKDIPIIVVTGNCAETEKTRCLDPEGEIRAYNFFRKPFSFDECKSTVTAIQQENLDSANLPQTKVLILERDTFNKPISREHMEKQGFSSTSCFNEKEGLEIMEKEKFDVVLLDCDMPAMDDYGTAKKIKAIQPKCIIIGMTSKKREECLNKCLENGMYDVETKPVDFRKVAWVIERLVNDRNDKNNNMTSNTGSKVFI